MNHRAAFLSVALPVAFFFVSARHPSVVADAARVLRATLAWVS